MSWAADEFVDVDLGDKRLDSRLVKLCDSFSDAPESPINQACDDWHETKAAYRFFRNGKADVDRIMDAHRAKTAARAVGHETILAIQDTSYLVYTHHPKTEGPGEISLKKGSNKDKIYSRGLVMHTCLAVTDKGTPLGLLDQKVFARKLRPDHERRSMGGKYIQDVLPVEEKESYRWIEALEATCKSSDRILGRDGLRPGMRFLRFFQGGRKEWLFRSRARIPEPYREQRKPLRGKGSQKALGPHRSATARRDVRRGNHRTGKDETLQGSDGANRRNGSQVL
jgi:hypothetical protein